MLSLILFTGVFGQEEQITLSKEFSLSTSDPYPVVDGGKRYYSRGGEVLAVKSIKGQWIFQKFSGSNLNENLRNIELKPKEAFVVEGYIELGERIYMFYSTYDKANDKEKLYVREIDFENAKFSGQAKLLFDVKGKVGTTQTMAQRYDKFTFELNFDEDKLLVRYRMVPAQKNDDVSKDKIGMHVFDTSLNELWSGIVKMPYTEKKMNNIDYTIDNAGNVYILAEIYKDNTTKRETKEGNPNYFLEMIRVDSGDQSVTSSKIEAKDKFVDAISFFEGKNEELILAGYYEKNFQGGVDGVFMIKINGEGELYGEVSYEIPSEIIKQYMSEKSQEKVDKIEAKGKLTISNLKLRNVVFNEDGSIALIGERNYSVTNCDSKGNCTTTYFYMEMLLTTIGSDGELQYMKKLPKHQRGSLYRGGMGFYYFGSEMNHYMLFMDNLKNVNLTMDKAPAAHSDGRGGFLTGYKVNKETGETERVSLFDIRNVNGMELYQFETSRIIQINDNEFAVECYIKGKQDIMLKLTLNE